MSVAARKSISTYFEELGAKEVSRLLNWEYERLCSVSPEEMAGSFQGFLEACFGKECASVEKGEWELFRKWHASTSEDENLTAIFRSFERQVEESVEFFFMDLASASETCSGDFFNDDTHDSFYLAAREVNSLGLRIQLEFLRDNAPSIYSKFLDMAGLKFILPKNCSNRVSIEVASS
ncbi:hypothetical protein [Pelagicoccus mobilis]|uniref:Uncharacterized protein n=1 Tax=Pelagicoccus mobilis TaxID=415221 RepID=A0A934S3F7_9BACT|nr:hypothetical protein [Pelagicoccus mobilis]MBK1878709.1 hypothetical protein [Pelagicoccus mobilis]